MKQEKKFRTGNRKNKFRVMRIHQINILYLFAADLRDIKKIAFSAKLRPVWRHGSRKIGLRVKNGIFSENLGVKGLIVVHIRLGSRVYQENISDSCGNPRYIT